MYVLLSIVGIILNNSNLNALEHVRCVYMVERCHNL